MTATKLIAAEARKLATTRGAYLFVAGIVAVSVITVLDPAQDAASFERAWHEQTFVLFTSLLSRILVLVMGIRAVTDEMRFGTIVPSVLVTPRRHRLIAAKAVTTAVFGAALAAIAWTAATVAAGAVASANEVTLVLDENAWRSLAGMIGAGAAWAVVGLGLGVVVRSQVVATVGGVAWLMGVEDAVRGAVGDLAGYLPGQAGTVLATSPSPRAATVAAATMCAYAALALLGASLAIRRDLT